MDFEGVAFGCAFGLLDDGVDEIAAFFFGGEALTSSDSVSSSSVEIMVPFLRLRLLPPFLAVAGLDSLRETCDYDKRGVGGW